MVANKIIVLACYRFTAFLKFNKAKKLRKKIWSKKKWILSKSMDIGLLGNSICDVKWEFCT